MARSGWSAANYLSLASAPVTAAPYTIACWAITSIASAAQAMVALNRSASDNDYILLTTDAANHIQGAVAQSGGVAFNTTTTYATDTWFHACMTVASATSRAVFLNGGGKGTATASEAPASISLLHIGVYKGASVLTPFAPAGTGSIAEVGIWNVALSDAEVALLAAGLSPLLMRPGSLVFYAPLVRGLVNRKGTALTEVGTVTVSTHPRIIYPVGPSLMIPPPVLPPVTRAFAFNFG